MTVYVDDMHKFPMGRYGRMRMSHLIADTDDEMHAMADRIGVARRWFQRVPSGNHYDIALSKRALAVEAGAVEITMKELAAFAWHKRTFGFCCVPAVALEKMQSAAKARAAEVKEEAV